MDNETGDEEASQQQQQPDMTTSGEPNNSNNNEEGADTHQPRPRAVSGSYGFSQQFSSSELAQHQQPAITEEADEEDEPDQVLWTAEDGELAPLDDTNADSDGREGDGASSSSSRPHVYSLLGTGASQNNPSTDSSQAKSGEGDLSPNSTETSRKPRQRLMTMKPPDQIPSDNRDRRAIRLERKTPKEPLGITLCTAKIPKRDASGNIVNNELTESTFVESCKPDGLGYRCGLRAGDQILDVDGEPCLNTKHNYVVRLLTRNEGTIQLQVKYTTDYRKYELHKRKARLLKRLADKDQELRDIQAEEIEVLEGLAFSSGERRASSQSPGTGTEDLCAEDVLEKWKGTPEELVAAMVEQWSGERLQYTTKEKELKAKLAAARVSGSGSTSSSVVQRTSVVKGRVVLNLTDGDMRRRSESVVDKEDLNRGAHKHDDVLADLPPMPSERPPTPPENQGGVGRKDSEDANWV